MAKATEDQPTGNREPSSNDGSTQDASFARFLPVAAALLLIAVALITLVLQDRQYSAEASPDAYRQAAEHIRAHWTDGDVIRIEPVWLDDPRVYLDGFEFDPASQPLLENLGRYRRVWILAGYSRGDTLSLPEGFREIERHHFGKVDLLLFEAPASETPRFNFLAALRKAKVYRLGHDGKGRQECHWKDAVQAFHCGRIDAWLFVAERLTDLDGEPHRCIYMPPLPEKKKHRVTFEKVLLQSRIVGRVGQSSVAVRAERGSDVHFDVTINGEPAHTLVLPPHDGSAFTFDIDTAELAGQPADVSFTVWANDFFDRYPCFSASVF